MRTTYAFQFLAWLCLALSNVSAMADGPNLVRNGDFSDSEAKSRPRDWQVSFTGKGVEGRSSTVNGPGGKTAIKIECMEFPEENASAWVIFSQNGTVHTKRNQNLYISFWVKKEKIKGAQVEVSIMRRQPWAAIARMSVPITQQWSQVELVLTPHTTCEDTRFQIVFEEPGTLYLSDIRVAETTKNAFEVNPVRRKMERLTKLATEKNLVGNGSFEAGNSDWGTEGFDHNVVQIDKTQAYHGQCSARMDLDRDSLPFGYSDYPVARRIVFTNVKYASKGWIRFQKGEQYTLSAYLRSSKNDQKAEIGVFFMTGDKSLQRVDVTSQWRRYALTFKAKDLFGFPQIASSTAGGPSQLWIDAVQLEKSDQATAYQSRYPVEVAFHPKRSGGIYYQGEAVDFAVDSYFDDNAAGADVDLKVLDYRGQMVHQRAFALTGDSALSHLPIPVTENGHYQVLAVVKGEGFEFRVKTPFVIIYPYAKTHGNKDARFGTNHPYYSDLLQKAARDAGVYWVRDWTLKWDNVESKQGEWDFSGPKILFDRAERLDLRVLAILPDPSSSWASSGPAAARGKRLGDAFEDLWYLPENMEDYRRYVRQCIERYHDQTHVWEALNEPYRGKTRQWKVEDTYLDFLAIVKEEAAKVAANQKVMRCGLVYYGEHEAPNVHAARVADILSEHAYPLYNNTRRFLLQTNRIDGFLKKHQVDRDIWVTEYGKYSNDNPNYRHAGFNHYLANGDERTAAAYNVKYLTVLFSHGTNKVFFHQRTWAIGMNEKLNRIHFDMLFDYGPTPHKFFVAANAMSWFLRPGTGPGVAVNETGPIFAYSFERTNDKVLLVWTDKTFIPLNQEMQPLVGRVSNYGMMGNRFETIQSVGEEPIYLIGSTKRIDAIEEALKCTFPVPD